MTRRVLRKLSIAEISAVDRPANALARATIMKREGDSMTTFTKSEVAADWNAAVAALAKRCGISKDEATLKLSTTAEGGELYSRYRTARSDSPIVQKQPALSKAEQHVATMDVTLVEFAKMAFPEEEECVAIAKFLETPQGRDFYADHWLAMRTAASHNYA